MQEMSGAVEDDAENHWPAPALKCTFAKRVLHTWALCDCKVIQQTEDNVFCIL